jgi:hypothetical protein
MFVWDRRSYVVFARSDKWRREGGKEGGRDRPVCLSSVSPVTVGCTLNDAGKFLL